MTWTTGTERSFSPAARTDAQHGEVACPGERADRGSGALIDLAVFERPVWSRGRPRHHLPSDMTASAADVTRVYRELFGEQSLQADVVR